MTAARFLSGVVIQDLEEMKAQLEESRVVMKRNEYLEGLNATLQERVVQMELELERVRSMGMSNCNSGPLELKHSLNGGSGDLERDVAQQDTLVVRGSGGTTAEDGDTNDYAVQCANLDLERVAQLDGRDHVELRGEFAQHIQAIKESLEKHGISQEYDPSAGDVAAGLSQEVVKEIWTVILQTCQVCHACLNSRGPEITTLIGEWQGEMHGKEDVYVPLGCHGCRGCFCGHCVHCGHCGFSSCRCLSSAAIA
jgi:hypothetical protein